MVKNKEPSVATHVESRASPVPDCFHTKEPTCVEVETLVRRKRREKQEKKEEYMYYRNVYVLQFAGVHRRSTWDPHPSNSLADTWNLGIHAS